MCVHDGNLGLEGILAGSRAVEKAGRLQYCWRARTSDRSVVNGVFNHSSVINSVEGPPARASHSAPTSDTKVAASARY